MKTPRHLLALLLPLVMGGCLLPQPDTPPVGPPNAPTFGHGAVLPAQPQAGNSGSQIAPRPNTATGANPAGPGAAAPVAGDGALAPAPTAMGRILGQFSGLSISAYAFNSEFAPNAATPPLTTVGPQGAFDESLPAGRYYLYMRVLGRSQIVVVQGIALGAGQTRQVTVTLSDNPLRASLTEDLPLASAPPSPSPSAP